MKLFDRVTRELERFLHQPHVGTWLICGGRDFSNRAMFDNTMRDLVRRKGWPQKIVHGGASGADSMAASWAEQMDIEAVEVPADWATHGKAAGPIRNQQMLDLHDPQLVVAFPGGKGTLDMATRARKAGVAVIEISIVKMEQRETAND